jgi:hypothetical protein
VLSTFKQAHPELFNQASAATTPVSGSTHGATADGVTDEMAQLLRANKIPLPGSANHWSTRKNADVLGAVVGHNVGATPYGKVN